MHPELLDLYSDFRVNLYRKSSPVSVNDGVNSSGKTGEPVNDGVNGSGKTGEPVNDGVNASEWSNDGVNEPVNEPVNNGVNGSEKAGEPVNEPVNKPVNEPVNELNDDVFKAVLSIIYENPEITIQELSDSVHKSKSTLKRYISKLKSLGILMREGADKNGRWIVKHVGN